MAISTSQYLGGGPFYLYPPPSSFSLSLNLTPSALRTNSPTSTRKKKAIRCSVQLLADLAPAASAGYGSLLLAGGIFAYGRSGSKGSILGGLSGAALMAVTYYLMQSPETKQAGEALGFGSAFLFSSVFGIRLAATRKLIPSGLLLATSFGALAVFFSAYMQDKIPADITPMLLYNLRV